MFHVKQSAANGLGSSIWNLSRGWAPLSWCAGNAIRWSDSLTLPMPPGISIRGSSGLSVGEWVLRVEVEVLDDERTSTPAVF